jgi:hypothetical protein
MSTGKGGAAGGEGRGLLKMSCCKVAHVPEKAFYLYGALEVDCNYGLLSFCPPFDLLIISYGFHFRGLIQPPFSSRAILLYRSSSACTKSPGVSKKSNITIPTLFPFMLFKKGTSC